MSNALVRAMSCALVLILTTTTSFPPSRLSRHSGIGAAGVAEYGAGAYGVGVAGAGAYDVGLAGAGAYGVGVAGAGAYDVGLAGAGAYGVGVAGAGAYGVGLAGAGAYGVGVAGVGVAGVGVAGVGVAGVGVAGVGVAGVGAFGVFNTGLPRYLRYYGNCYQRRYFAAPVRRWNCLPRRLLYRIFAVPRGVFFYNGHWVRRGPRGFAIIFVNGRCWAPRLRVAAVGAFASPYGLQTQTGFGVAGYGGIYSAEDSAGADDEQARKLHDEGRRLQEELDAVDPAYDYDGYGGDAYDDTALPYAVDA